MDDIFSLKATRTKIEKLKSAIKLLERLQPSSLARVSNNFFPSKFNDAWEEVTSCVNKIDQDISDIHVVLGTTLQHSTDLENDLSFKQELLQSLWKKYEFIVNTSNEWTSIITKDYVFDSVNQNICDAFGQAKEQIEGSDVKALWGEDLFYAKLQPWIDHCFQGNVVSEELVLTLTGKLSLTLEIRLFPYKKDGDKVSQVVLMARDISKLRAQQNLLTEQNLLLEQVNDAILIINEQGRIEYWNNSCVPLYGWSKEDSLGKSLETHLFFKDKDTYKLAMSQLKLNGAWEGEIKQTHKSNKTLFIKSKWSKFVDHKDGLKKIMIFNTNVTEQKNIEHQFYRIQRLDSIGSLASGIVHDLNNVLSAFFLAIRALKPKLTDEQGKTILSLMETSANRGVSLIRQILNFARGIDGEKSEVDLLVIIDELTVFIEETFPKTFSLNVDVTKELPCIYGSSTQVHQILLNLSVNARDAMEGAGNMSISAELETVSEERFDVFGQSQQPGSYVKLQISDEGPGVSQEIIGEIFTPFYTTKAKGKGTGLGLSTVKSIMANHRGFVYLDSVVDQGSVFTLYFPRLL